MPSTISYEEAIRPSPPLPPASSPIADGETQCKVLYDFEAQSPNELTIKKDDLVVIVEKADSGKPTKLNEIKGNTFNLNRLVAGKRCKWSWLGAVLLRRRDRF